MPTENSGFENGLDVTRCETYILVIKIDEFHHWNKSVGPKFLKATRPNFVNVLVSISLVLTYVKIGESLRVEPYHRLLYALASSFLQV